MKEYFLRVLLLLMVIPAVGLLLGSSLDTTVKISCAADLDHDGAVETVRLEGGYGPFGKFLVIREDNGAIMRFDLSAMRPWKVQTADIDGDGERELSIGVYTTARSDPSMNKRPFLFRVTDRGLHPIWLGTRLSKPFEDYGFSDMNDDGRDELVAIEYLADGRKVLAVYGWKGFGFEGLCQSQDFQDIRKLKTDSSDGAQPSAMATLDNGTLRRVVLHYDQGVLTLE